MALLDVGSEAGEDSWAVEKPVPERNQEPTPPGGALLPGQHGGCTVRPSCQVTALVLCPVALALCPWACKGMG